MLTIQVCEGPYFKTYEPGEGTIDTAWDGKVKLIVPYGISDQTAAADAKAGAIASIDQFVILPRPTPDEGKTYATFEEYAQLYERGEELGIDDGDSGSVVLNSEDQVVAQVVRRMPQDKNPMFKEEEKGAIELRDVKYMIIASPIHWTLEQLEITIPSTPGWSGTAPSSGETVEVPIEPAFVRQQESVARLRTELLRSRRGRLLLGKINQHRREVRELLSRVRAVSTTWSALGGPALYHHCLASVRDPSHLIPVRINGISRERLVERLLPVLAQHASPALRRDIDRYRDWAAAALLHIAAMSDVPAAAARRWSPT